MSDQPQFDEQAQKDVARALMICAAILLLVSFYLAIGGLMHLVLMGSADIAWTHVGSIVCFLAWPAMLVSIACVGMLVGRAIAGALELGRRAVNLIVGKRKA
jgi:hypothetical protein